MKHAQNKFIEVIRKAILIQIVAFSSTHIQCNNSKSVVKLI